MKHTAHVVVRDENGQQVWAGTADVTNGRIELPELSDHNTADATGAGASSSSRSSSSPTLAKLRGEQ